MASNVPSNVPLACSLSAAELRVRGAENAALFARSHSAQELSDGYSFVFPASEECARDLLEFVLAERACCPFFTFELTFAAPHESIQLAVRGREGVKEIMREGVISRLAAPTSAHESIG
jgi:hypothetical protein